MTRRLVGAAIIALAIGPAWVRSAPAPTPVPLASHDDTRAAVDFLLLQVKTSGARFIRNGKTYDGDAAVKHLRRKYRYFERQIRTPEDFIRLCATKSEASGKPYLVETAPGRSEPCADWMTRRLADYRRRER